MTDFIQKIAVAIADQRKSYPLPQAMNVLVCHRTTDDPRSVTIGVADRIPVERFQPLGDAYTRSTLRPKAWDSLLYLCQQAAIECVQFITETKSWVHPSNNTWLMGADHRALRSVPWSIDEISEGLFTIDQVIRIVDHTLRTKPQGISMNCALWIDEHPEELAAHAGKRVAIHPAKGIVAVGETYTDVIDELKRAGLTMYMDEISVEVVHGP